MPYPKSHKQNSRNKILHSAFSLFCSKGYDNVTIDQIMQNSQLTRGAFYAHFKNKAALYTQVISHAASHSTLRDLKPDNLNDKQWLDKLLTSYLRIEHVNGTRPCPLAFLVTDIAVQNNAAKQAYANSFTAMNRIIHSYTEDYTHCTTATVESVVCMIIGAVAICRTMQDPATITALLSSCLTQAKQALDL